MCFLGAHCLLLVPVVAAVGAAVGAAAGRAVGWKEKKVLEEKVGDVDAG